MGGRLASASRYGGAGLTLLTEVGGNLVVADGAQLAFQGNASTANPHIINLEQLGNGDGIRLINSGQMDLVMNSTVVASLTNAVFRVLSALRTDGIIYHIPSADQTLDAVGSTLTVNAAHLKAVQTGTVTSTATPFMAAGVDGQRVLIEFIGAGSFTLQDEATLAGTGLQLQNGSNQSFNANDIVEFVYSTDQALWCQVITKMGL